MKVLKTLFLALALVTLSVSARAETYDSTKDPACNNSPGSVWSFEAYRAEDKKYLPMTNGHAPLDEINKYGIDCSFITDSDQPYHPYMLKFPDVVIASPSTLGRGFDAVLVWNAPESSNISVEGSARLMGDIYEKTTGKTVGVEFLNNDKKLWDSEVTSGQTKEYKLETRVKKGDKLRLKVSNMGDKSGAITKLEMRVTTSSK